MIKLAQLQYTKTSGGSAATRLHNAFPKSTIQSSIISLHPDINDDEKTFSLNGKARLIARLNNKIQSFLTRKEIKTFGGFIYPTLGTNVSEMEPIKKADIIYLHWILNGFLSIRNIRQLAELNKPVVIFLHDMWPITGGCQHSFDCKKYESECQNCQMFPDNKINDLSRKGFKKKLKLYSERHNIYFVSPSKWMYNCATRSALTKNKQVFHIPNILNTEIFKPFDKLQARKILNINTSETIIAFGAVSINNPYKGWEYLQKALILLQGKKAFKNCSILVFGRVHDDRIANAIPFKTRFMGYLNDEYSIALIYNAADVFVAPSLADTSPFTVKEALSCGTPVVGFDIGGLTELIEHKKNGYLAKYKNAEDISRGIQYCLENNIKGYQPEGLDMETVIKKHFELFDYIKVYNK